MRRGAARARASPRMGRKCLHLHVRQTEFVDLIPSTTFWPEQKVKTTQVSVNLDYRWTERLSTVFRYLSSGSTPTTPSRTASYRTPFFPFAMSTLSRSQVAILGELVSTPACSSRRE